MPTELLQDMGKLIEPASVLETQPTLHPTPRNKGLNTNSQLAARFYTVAFTAGCKEEIPGETKFLGKWSRGKMVSHGITAVVSGERSGSCFAANFLGSGLNFL